MPNVTVLEKYNNQEMWEYLDKRALYYGFTIEKRETRPSSNTWVDCIYVLFNNYTPGFYVAPLIFDSKTKTFNITVTSDSYVNNLVGWFSDVESKFDVHFNIVVDKRQGVV
jgi:hypothetical protein